MIHLKVCCLIHSILMKCNS